MSLRSVLRTINDLLNLKKCANCGKPIKGKGLKWRGKQFCSRKCKREYREKHRKKSKSVFLPSDTFEALYWRRKS